MQLKSLEIKGFKSFANETVIHFNEAVTGIVGPNGSGKSNVVDAMRWVLGEQKGRELRLEAMSDVIFNGTKKRREAPMAQVSLTFENTKNIIPTDYQTVTISRLLYRSGESEYRLNNVACRLKDITGLFLDTGIGPDSYAIIALNMVEELLSNKENARRKMFEQAAGISKYKTRKRESINKLKSTNEDLARIEDLLFEINNNLLELEKQAKRAKKFYEMRDKFRSAGLLLAHISINNLKNADLLTEQNLIAETDAFRELEVKMRSQEAELEKFKKEHLDYEKNLSEYQKNVNQLLDTIRNLESEIQIKQQKKSLFDSQIIQMKDSENGFELKLTNFNTEISGIDIELLALEQELFQTEEKYITLADELNQVQQKFNDLKSEVDSKIKQRQNLDKIIFENEKEMAILSNQIDNLNAENKRANEELNSRSKEFVNAEKEIQEQKQLSEKYNSEISDLTNSETKRKESIADLQTQIDKQIGIVNSLNRTKDARQNEFDLLQSMIERMEGFPESMQFLNSNWKKNVPVLSDVIAVQEQYKSAIELCLESYLNYYIVDDEKDAFDAIRLLKQEAKGKANFFLLNKVRTSQERFSQPPGTMPAIDVLECDHIYRPLIQQLLSNVFISQDNDGSSSLNLDEGVTVVSANGTYLKQNKTISGGSTGLFEGKRLGRKKSLEKLETELIQLRTKISESEIELANLRSSAKQLEEKSYEKELTELRYKESQSLQKHTELSTRFNSFMEAKKQIDSRIIENQSQVSHCQNLISKHTNELSLLRVSLEEITLILGQNDSIVNQSSTELANASVLANQANLDLLKTKNKFENLQKDKIYRENQKNSLLEDLQSNRQKVEELNKDILTLDNEVAELMLRLDTGYTERKNLQSNLSVMEQEYYEVRNYISLSEQSIKESQRAIYEYQSSINSLKEKKKDILYRMNSTQERAELEFGTKFENFQADDETKEMDESQLSDRVNYYKVRLDNYGEVNPLAMEAYDEMKARYDVIHLQREDILSAKDSLLQTIKEIEEKATSNFLESFNQVRVHFQTVFRSLFTEDDDCDLILMDEMDPLECDIDIIAKPKGKKPKSISQLSGGEKTLTAIALLFSLYLLKPAPFCIFDEVDAPLDDVNIEKFNKIVRQFSKESQFIIITHNKLTMAEVDILYGVYMEEQGVSGVAAVDFRKYDYDTIMTEMQG